MRRKMSPIKEKTSFILFLCISKADKIHIVCREKISFFFPSDEYDLYFFTVANTGYFDNLGLNFFQKRSGMHRYCLTLRYGSTHVK